MNILISFVGGMHGQYGKDFKSVLNRLNDPCIQYLGHVPQDEIQNLYHANDAVIFASSCENFPNIILEAMASGLPVITSDRGPMPDIVGSEGFYFDPYSERSIANAIREVYNNYSFGIMLGSSAQSRAIGYLWRDTAMETFEFISLIYHQHSEKF
jgi:glycosyltransferase involved in cell wall biosynthesis